MVNKLKKEIKNKWIEVNGIRQSNTGMLVKPCKVECCITNDEAGKTLSVLFGGEMVTIPFEPLEKYLN